MWKPGKGPAALLVIVGGSGAVASGWEQGWGWLAQAALQSTFLEHDAQPPPRPWPGG